MRERVGGRARECESARVRECERVRVRGVRKWESGTVGQRVSGRVGEWEGAGVRACRIARVEEVRQVGTRVGGNNGADLAATHGPECEDPRTAPMMSIAL